MAAVRVQHKTVCILKSRRHSSVDPASENESQRKRVKTVLAGALMACTVPLYDVTLL